MLHPSYQDLMQTINERDNDVELKSRYSIVIATSKRARDIIDNNKLKRENDRDIDNSQKPLSKAIYELKRGDIDIMSREKKERNMLNIEIEAAKSDLEENRQAFKEVLDEEVGSHL